MKKAINFLFQAPTKIQKSLIIFRSVLQGNLTDKKLSRCELKNLNLISRYISDLNIFSQNEAIKENITPRSKNVNKRDQFSIGNLINYSFTNRSNWKLESIKTNFTNHFSKRNDFIYESNKLNEKNHKIQNMNKCSSLLQSSSIIPINKNANSNILEKFNKINFQKNDFYNTHIRTLLEDQKQIDEGIKYYYSGISKIKSFVLDLNFVIIPFPKILKKFSNVTRLFKITLRLAQIFKITMKEILLETSPKY